MKILAIERSGLFYGSAVNLRDWIEEYCKRPKYTVDVLVGEGGEIVEKLEAAGGNVFVRPLPSLINKYGKRNIGLIKSLITCICIVFYNLKQIVKTHKSYDILVFNNYRTAVYYLLFLTYFRIFTKSKIVVRLQISQRPIRILFKLIEKLSHSIIVHGTLGYCIREFGKSFAEQSKVTCLPNPVDTNLYRPNSAIRKEMRQQLRIPQDTFVILSVCYIEPRKGVLQLVETFTSLDIDNCLLLHAGDHGSHEAYFKSVLNAKNGEVIFLGKRDDLSRLYNVADVFVLNSEYEGMPYVIVEAMAMQLPIIGTYSGSNEEVVSPACGTLVHYDDNEKLGEAILGLYKDTKLRLDMGLAARNRVESAYSKGAYLVGLEKIIG